MIAGLLQALLGVIVVSPAGPVRTLSEAIRLARPGDRIEVRAGLYREPVIVVDRRVEIVGVGRPVFDGGGNHTVIVIRADSVRIRGLVVRNTGASGVEDRAGIRLERVRGAVVEDNEVRDAFFGIYGEAARDGRIAGNRVDGGSAASRATGNAIHCWSCAGMLIEDNRARGHRDGVYLEFTSGSRIRRNRIEHNLRYGLHFMFSDSSSYADNLFARNGAGVAVMYSRHIHIAGNRFVANRGSASYGLLLKEISESEIRDNRFSGNTTALTLENSNRNLIEGNLFEDNGRAVRMLANAVGNQVRRNVFRRNSFDVTTNSRSATSRFEENFWDHYAGYDLDRDGIGDVAFRPVRLFSLLVERHDPAIILLRSPFVSLLDAAERLFPLLTPVALADARPLMRAPQ